VVRLASLDIESTTLDFSLNIRIGAVFWKNLGEKQVKNYHF
jgi:hypothetical protein